MSEDLRSATLDTSSPEFELDLDMSLDEHLLSRKDPYGYDLNVNGIRHIFVKDESIGVRWVMKDGKAVLKDIYLGVF